MIVCMDYRAIEAATFEEVKQSYLDNGFDEEGAQIYAALLKVPEARLDEFGEPFIID